MASFCNQTERWKILQWTHSRQNQTTVLVGAIGRQTNDAEYRRTGLNRQTGGLTVFTQDKTIGGQERETMKGHLPNLRDSAIGWECNLENIPKLFWLIFTWPHLLKPSLFKIEQLRRHVFWAGWPKVVQKVVLFQSGNEAFYVQAEGSYCQAGITHYDGASHYCLLLPSHTAFVQSSLVGLPVRINNSPCDRLLKRQEAVNASEWIIDSLTTQCADTQKRGGQWVHGKELICLIGCHTIHRMP